MPRAFIWINTIFGPWHDKINKMSVHPAKTQISLGICPVWSELAVRSMDSWGPKVSSCGQRRLWSDCTDALADLSLRWAHSHFVGFIMLRLKYRIYLVLKHKAEKDTLIFKSDNTCIPLNTRTFESRLLHSLIMSALFNSQLASFWIMHVVTHLFMCLDFG